MTWRLAKSLGVLRDQINARWPNRAKGNDGTIGDERHQASKSEHNPDANGVVRAMDITRDMAHGLDSRAVAQGLLSSRDPRILYVISDGQICSSRISPWLWRKYTGADPHDHHFHISVVEDPRLYDDVRPWKLAVPAAVPGRMLAIFATEFGGSLDPNNSAYDGHLITDAELGVALPATFLEPRPAVRVIREGRSVVAPIIDKGPWNVDDPYWVSGSRPQAETGTDNRGRKTNKAGIDLTPATMTALGVAGPLGTRSAVVDWEFATSAPATTPTPVPVPPPAAPPPPIKEPSMDLFKFLPLLMRILQIIPQIQDAMKSGQSIFTLLQKFAPDMISILTGVGSTLFPDLHPVAQAQVGGLMMDPVKVRLIQGQINKLGLANPALVEDGYYGQKTKDAIAAFQTAHGITPDGWAGDVTTAALQVEVNKLAVPLVPTTPGGPVVSLALPK